MTQHNRKISSIVKSLLEWFSQNARDLPWRRTRDPYGIWVSEIMLQQTQVKTVIPYWERWMRALPTVKDLAEANSDLIHKLWEGLGYYTRVRNMQKAAQTIMAEHGGIFPREYEKILALSGIGRYTAGAISSIAFNEPKPILDGNVIRVLTRVFGIAENPKEKSANEKLWQLAESLVTTASHFSLRSPHSEIRTSQTCSHLNQSLMELGALICTPKQPKCLICPLREQCVAFKTNRVEELPNLGPRTIATPRYFKAVVVEHRNRFLVRQRPAGIVNAHLWEFPNVECTASDSDEKAFAQFDFKIKEVEKLCTIKHSITRYRITLEAFHAKLKGSLTKTLSGSWLSLEQLDTLAFTSAHRKILERLKSEKD